MTEDWRSFFKPGWQFVLGGRDGHTPIAVDDPLKWSMWMEANWNKRTVALTQIGEMEVSTVFLGLNHSFYRDGPPLLFETMIFLPPEEMRMMSGKRVMLPPTLDFQTRYATWEEAEAGHAKAVEYAKKVLADAGIEVDEALAKKPKGVSQ